MKGNLTNEETSQKIGFIRNQRLWVYYRNDTAAGFVSARCLHKPMSLVALRNNAAQK